jgi:hypothetical protein
LRASAALVIVRMCRRSERLYAIGKAVPSQPEVYFWALLVLLDVRGDERSNLPRIREWASDVLKQKQSYEQVLGLDPPAALAR